MSKNFKRVGIMCVVLSVQNVFAQQKSSLLQPEVNFDQHDSSTVIKTQMGVNAVSSALNFAYMNKMFMGGFLTQEVIEKNRKNLGPINRIGIETDLNTRVWFQSKKDQSHSKSYATVGYKQLLGGQFNPASWSLAMKGNAPFAGETLELKNLGYKQMQWFQVGMGKKWWSHNQQMSFAGGVSLYTSWQFQNVYVEKGSVFTDTSGKHIDIALKGNWQRLMPSKVAPGMGLNLELKGKLSNESSWRLAVSDLGLLYTPKAGQKHDFDTSFRFTGVYVYDIKSIAEKDYWENKADSVFSPISVATSSAKSFLLPCLIDLSWQTALGSKQQIGAAISYRALVYALPKVNVWHAANFNQGFYVRSELAYGGWGGFQFNETVGFQINRFALAVKIGGFQSALVGALPFQTTGQLQFVAAF